MKPKTIYLVLCILALAVPYAAFIPWLAETASTDASFCRIFSPIASAPFSHSTSSFPLWSSSDFPRWNAGVSLGLPLLLYFRERQLEPTPTAA